MMLFDRIAMHLVVLGTLADPANTCLLAGSSNNDPP